MRPEDILSTMETCQYLGITRQTLYSWMKQKKIKPWRKMGGRTAWFFFKKDVVKAKGQRYKQKGKRP